MPTLHLIIKGHVQGVFYRASAKDAAEELGVTGWIKNTPDGEVEALASGSQEKIEQFVEWCKKGPRRARVSEVIVNEGDEKHFEEFSVIR
jgi:acylphosphatase